MIEKVICREKIHVICNLIARVHEGYNKLLDLYGSQHAFLVFIIWVMGGDEMRSVLVLQDWLSKDLHYLITVNLRVSFTP